MSHVSSSINRTKQMSYNTIPFFVKYNAYTKHVLTPLDLKKGAAFFCTMNLFDQCMWLGHYYSGMGYGLVFTLKFAKYPPELKRFMS